MNSRSMFAATFFAAFLSATAAIACIPYYHVELDASPFATPDRIAFALSGDFNSEDSVGFVVKDKGTLVEVPGTKTKLDDSNIFIFTPEAPLTAGGQYLLEFTPQLGHNAVTGFEVEIIEEAPSATVSSIVGQINRVVSKQTCCSNQEECFPGSCDNCRTCWPGAYEYRPSVLITLTAGRVPVIIDAFVYEEGNEVGEVQTIFGQLGFQNVPLDNRLARESGAGVCVRTVIRDLDNLLLLESIDCVASDAFPTFRREIPDFPDAVAQCVAPPDNLEDNNWQRYGGEDTVNSEIPEVDGPKVVGKDGNSTRHSDDEGCSSTGDSRSDFGLIFVLALFGVTSAGRRRR